MKLSELLAKLHLKGASSAAGSEGLRELTLDEMVPDRTPIDDCRPRNTYVVAGVASNVEVRDHGGTDSFSATLDDGTGSLDLVWVGRPPIPGIVSGTVLRAKGTVAQSGDTKVIVDPSYAILDGSSYE